MPVSKAIDFIKRFGMFVIICSMPVGISPLVASWFFDEVFKKERLTKIL